MSAWVPPRVPLTPEQESAIVAEPFVNLEGTNSLAVNLAHREIVRLKGQPWLNEFEIRSLKILYEVIERAKDMELKEWTIRNKAKR